MLEVRDLRVSYGKIRAVQGVSLTVAQGEIVALIGPNGAGKSSTLQAICGIVKPSGGEVALMGEPIAGLPSHAIVRRGLVQVPEGRLIFPGLTIAENLLLGAYPVSDLGRQQRRVQELLELFPDLKERLSHRGASLSGGQAQMLALARGLMANPKLLLLDEPSLGLAPLAVREVFALLNRLRERGTTVLLVEQNVRQALAVADRGYVLESGKVILQGRAGELLNHQHVAQPPASGTVLFGNASPPIGSSSMTVRSC